MNNENETVEMLDEQDEQEQQEEAGSGSNPSDAEGGTDDEGSDQGEGVEEVLIRIEGEESQNQDEDEDRAPSWVRDVRKQSREKDRRIRELESRLSERESPKAQAVHVGEKPTMESCDYDPEDYEQKLEQWHDRKRQAAAKEAEQKQAEDAQKAEWTARLEKFEKAKASIGVRDYAELESNARDHLSNVQLGIIVDGAENPALVVAALGQNPATAKRLSEIKNHVQFAFAVAKLESKMKTEKTTRPATSPERMVSGGGSGGVKIGGGKLEALRAEAEKTGDYSKVVAFKRANKK